MNFFSRDEWEPVRQIKTYLTPEYRIGSDARSICALYAEGEDVFKEIVILLHTEHIPESDPGAPLSRCAGTPASPDGRRLRGLAQE